MSFLLDTNVVSELRKGRRADANVREWFRGVPADELYLSVLVVGELRRGIESVRRRDPKAAAALEGWLRELVAEHDDRILEITTPIAELWGALNVPDPLPVVDSLIAATAILHGLTVVSRDTGDIRRTGVAVIDPFEPASR